MEIEIKGLNFPSEEVLQFIESKHPISIARDGFVSREYYNAHHPEGKHTPARLLNGGKGDGNHIPIVDINGVFYVACQCTAAKKEVIPRHQGRNRER